MGVLPPYLASILAAVGCGLMGAVASEDKAAGMARGLASGVHDVVWPAVLALAALLARGILAVRARRDKPATP